MCWEKRDRRSGICCVGIQYSVWSITKQTQLKKAKKKGKKRRKKQKRRLGELTEIHAPDLFVVIGLGTANSAHDAGLRDCRLKMRIPIARLGTRLPTNWEHHDVTRDGALYLWAYERQRHGRADIERDGHAGRRAGRTETDLGICKEHLPLEGCWRVRREG